MAQMHTWMILVGVVGGLAVVVGAALLWVLLTQPVAVAQAVARAL
jgi:putative flippase GtrA